MLKEWKIGLICLLANFFGAAVGSSFPVLMESRTQYYETGTMKFGCRLSDRGPLDNLAWVVECASSSNGACQYRQLVGPDEDRAPTFFMIVDSATAAEWNGANYSCRSRETGLTTDKIRLTVLPKPLLIMSPSSLVYAYFGTDVEVGCTGSEFWRSLHLSTNIFCNRCTPTERQTTFNDTTILVRFNATMEWNDAVITCFTERLVRQSNSTRVVVRHIPFPTIKPNNQVVTYVGRYTTVTCSIYELWTVSQLSWTISGCQQRNNDTQAEENNDGCRFSADNIVDNVTRRATFVASQFWNGAELICDAVGKMEQRQSRVQVQVIDFPGLEVVPSSSILTLNSGVNTTLFCAVVGYLSSEEIIWTATGCTSGPCPPIEQGLSLSTGVRSTAASTRRKGTTSATASPKVWRYISFVATIEWNTAKLTCSVNSMNAPSASRSTSIYVVDPDVVDYAGLFIGAFIVAILLVAVSGGSLYYAIRNQRKQKVIILGTKSRNTRSTAADGSAGKPTTENTLAATDVTANGKDTLKAIS